MKKILILLFMLFCLSGCMESRELKERTIIEAVGIDKEKGEYNLIFQQFQPSSGQGDTGSTSGNSGKSQPVQSKGRSISEAIERVTHYNGNEVFLGNSTYIVLGSEMAGEGILRELHYFNGENEISPSTFLLIADGTALDLISAQAENPGEGGSNIGDIMEQGQKNGIIGQASLIDVMKRLVDNSASPYLPVISEIKEGEKSIFKITGMAIFDREKMVDVLDIDEAKGILWANDELERALLVVEDPYLGILSAEVQNSKTKVKTELIEGVPYFQIEIQCSAQLVEVLGEDQSGSLNQKQMEKAASLLEQEISRLTSSAIDRAFTSQSCDIFRFCDYVKKTDPQYWKKNEKNWKELMSQCQIQVSVHCDLNKTGQQAME